LGIDYIGILFGAHSILHISRIKVNPRRIMNPQKEKFMEIPDIMHLDRSSPKIQWSSVAPFLGQNK
jgi:hypothetical protein